MIMRPPEECKLYSIIIILSILAPFAGLLATFFTQGNLKYFYNGCAFAIAGVIIANILQMLFEIRNYLEILCYKEYENSISVENKSEIKETLVQKGLNENLNNQNLEEKKVNISKQVNNRKQFLTLREKFSSLSFIERFFWITAFVVVGYFVMRGCRFKI